MSLLEAAVAAPRTEPGHRLVLLGSLGVLGIVGLDLLLGGDIGLFFDLCFVVLCLLLAVRADRGAFFTVAMLPPVLLVVSFGLVAATVPGALARPEDQLVQALVTGVTTHAVGLAAGYVLCLATLGLRMLDD
ncbi:hypothetical protein RDV89_00410 [Nocardioides zeae]|uniref:DUF6542 domain-containing protein n=1 Tax=Nocardioides imazamoxiresistens TaxID=3231893 RepID=A0ABU3PRK6_9ACTN|nr:DUF6542 domain-containing protein [Nocardioides zeae]MDT9591507.1 hypothetical protein [Nocardioides zeae]